MNKNMVLLTLSMFLTASLAAKADAILPPDDRSQAAGCNLNLREPKVPPCYRSFQPSYYEGQTIRGIFYPPRYTFWPNALKGPKRPPSCPPAYKKMDSDRQIIEAEETPQMKKLSDVVKEIGATGKKRACQK